MRNATKKIARGTLGVIRDLFNPLLNFQEVSVLCYHSVSASAHDTAVTPAALESHLALLVKRGYIFVSLQDIAAWTKGERVLPRKAVALTFDDGYADFESAALPVLKRYAAPAAVFVIGEPAAAAYRTDEQPFLSVDALERLRQDPLVEVGYHSRTHPNLAKLADRELVGEVTPLWPAKFFAYPGGGHSPAAAAAVRTAGYQAAFTIRPVPVEKGMNLYLLPRTVVLKNMSPRDVAMRATIASRWYTFFANII